MAHPLYKIELTETVTYTVYIDRCPDLESAEEAAVDAWCCSTDPSATYEGTGEGVEVTNSYEYNLRNDDV